MAPRRPATAAEILQVLQQDPGIQKGRAMPYEHALTLLRLQLHTTPRKVKEWFFAATMQEPHEFELIGTLHGLIRFVGRGEEAVLLNFAGYISEVDTTYWPQLMRDGSAVSKDGDAEDGEFVVLSKHLRAMCKRSAKHRAVTLKAQQLAQQVARDGAEERYGQALAYLRGLLVHAGLEPDDVLDARYRKGVTGESTQVSISLKDSAIDDIAEVLAAHDVEPYPPTMIVTRKPINA